jgi:hypothetical protein
MCSCTGTYPGAPERFMTPISHLQHPWTLMVQQAQHPALNILLTAAAALACCLRAGARP